MPIQPSNKAKPTGPLSEIRDLEGEALERCTTQELMNFVANVSLFVHGREPQAQDRVHARASDAMKVLAQRGVHEVPMSHWNFGRASRTTEGPFSERRYDPDWYKREAAEGEGLLARLRLALWKSR